MRGPTRFKGAGAKYYASVLTQLAKEPTEIISAVLHDAGILWPRPVGKHPALAAPYQPEQHHTLAPFDMPGRPVPREDRIDTAIAKAVIHGGQYIIAIGDLVTGFEAYGPFDSGHDAITWKSSTGVREMAHGQWYLMELKEPIKGRD